MLLVDDDVNVREVTRGMPEELGCLVACVPGLRSGPSMRTGRTHPLRSTSPTSTCLPWMVMSLRNARRAFGPRSRSCNCRGARASMIRKASSEEDSLAVSFRSLRGRREAICQRSLVQCCRQFTALAPACAFECVRLVSFRRLVLSRKNEASDQAALSRAHSATCAWVANQTSPLALACRINSSRIQIRER